MRLRYYPVEEAKDVLPELERRVSRVLERRVRLS